MMQLLYAYLNSKMVGCKAHDFDLTQKPPLSWVLLLVVDLWKLTLLCKLVKGPSIIMLEQNDMEMDLSKLHIYQNCKGSKYFILVLTGVLCILLKLNGQTCHRSPYVDPYHHASCRFEPLLNYKVIFHFLWC